MKHRTKVTNIQFVINIKRKKEVLSVFPCVSDHISVTRCFWEGGGYVNHELKLQKQD